MDIRKSKFIHDNLNFLSEQIQLNEQFWQRFENEKLFPKTYIDHMKNNDHVEEKNLKKNLLIDLTKRESPSSYEKMSKLFQDLYNCDYMNNWNKEHYPNSRPGYCLIINNEKFESTKIDNRYGSDCDVEKLSMTFAQLNFHIHKYLNLNKLGLLQILKQLINNQELNNYDLFILIIMSHGYSTHIITIDEQQIKYNDIIKMFSNQKCLQLKNKPKIIIFNCCRVEYNNSNNDNDNISDKIIIDQNQQQEKGKYHIDNEIKDTIVVYSTLDNYKSVRHKENGTFFVDALVKAIQEYKHSDLNKILLYANKFLIEKIHQQQQNDNNDKDFERRQVIEFTQKGVTKLIYFKCDDV